jgi:hypothetical protein
MERVLDLNIFYREFYTERLGTWWDNVYTIEAYVRTTDDNGAVYNTETGVVIKCDVYETQMLQKQFPEEEYGSDFWIFADEVDMPSRRIALALKRIDLDKPRENAATLTYSGPVTMA